MVAYHFGFIVRQAMSSALFVKVRSLWNGSVIPVPIFSSLEKPVEKLLDRNDKSHVLLLSYDGLKPKEVVKVVANL